MACSGLANGSMDCSMPAHMAWASLCVCACCVLCLQMCQRPVYGKKGTDITKLIPHSSYRYVEGVNDHKA